MSESFQEEPKKSRPDQDLSSIFDLSGDKKIANYVQRFEELYRQREAISAEIKQLSDDAYLDMMPKREVEACKKLAKWRLDDKLGGVQELMAAIKRVGAAIKVDLFNWQETKN